MASTKEKVVSLGVVTTVLTMVGTLLGDIYGKIDAVSSKAQAADTRTTVVWDQLTRQDSTITKIQDTVTKVNEKASRIEGKLDVLLDQRRR